MDDLAIHIEGLGKRYGEVVALDTLDLEVPYRSIFGFLGPNGAGKTTALRILLGLARPTAGSARVLGFDVVTQSLQVRERVGYLAQLPRFYEELSPRQTLRFALGFFPRDADRRIEDDLTEALDLVGLTDKADQHVGGLSGGRWPTAAAGHRTGLRASARAADPRRAGRRAGPDRPAGRAGAHAPTEGHDHDLRVWC